MFLSSYSISGSLLFQWTWVRQHCPRRCLPPPPQSFPWTCASWTTPITTTSSSPPLACFPSLRLAPHPPSRALGQSLVSVGWYAFVWWLKVIFWLFTTNGLWLQMLSNNLGFTSYRPPGAASAAGAGGATKQTAIPEAAADRRVPEAAWTAVTTTWSPAAGTYQGKVVEQGV